MSKQLLEASFVQTSVLGLLVGGAFQRQATAANFTDKTVTTIILGFLLPRWLNLPLQTTYLRNGIGIGSTLALFLLDVLAALRATMVVGATAMKTATM